MINTKFDLVYEKTNSCFSQFVVAINRGSSDEYNDISGLYHLLEHIKMNYTMLAKYNLVESNIKIKGYTTKEWTYYTLYTKSKNINSIIKNMLNLIYSDYLDNSILEIEKNIIMTEIQYYRFTNVFLKSLFNKTIWGNTFYGMPTVGDMNSIKVMNAEKVVPFINYKESDSMILCKTPWNKDKISDILSNYFTERITEPTFVNKTLPENVIECKKYNEKYHQCLFIIGTKINNRIDDRKILLAEIICSLLCDDSHGLLFNELRDSGKVYNIYLDVDIYSGSSCVFMGVNFNYCDYQKVTELIKKQLNGGILQIKSKSLDDILQVFRLNKYIRLKNEEYLIREQILRNYYKLSSKLELDTIEINELLSSFEDIFLKSNWSGISVGRIPVDTFMNDIGLRSNKT